MNNLLLLLTFTICLLVIALIIGQKPMDFRPCENYGKVRAKVILVEKDKIIYMCGKSKGKAWGVEE